MKIFLADYANVDVTIRSHELCACVWTNYGIVNEVRDRLRVIGTTDYTVNRGDVTCERLLRGALRHV